MVPTELRLVARARSELFETGSISEELQRAVRPEILASWRRSKAFGALPDGETLLPFRPDVEREGRLHLAAEPVLKALAQNLAGLNAGVLLADRDANILERWVADRSILPQLDRIRSEAGFGAPEDRVGTNGIGSVAETGQAHLVVGPEHYAEGLTAFACVGAPIRNPLSRRLEGIITMSLPADAANALLTPLMISTAGDIENRLLESATLEQRILFDAYLKASRRHYQSVAAVGRELFIGGPKVSSALEGVSPEALWDILARTGNAAGPTSHQVEDANGCSLWVTCTPVLRGDHLVGAIVELAPRPAGCRGVRRGERGAAAASGASLSRRSPAWSVVLEDAGRYAQQRLPVVLTGPSGVGKWTLLAEMAGAELTRAEAFVFDCNDIEEEGVLASRLASLEHRPAALVALRNLDRLDGAPLRLLTSALAQVADREDPPWIMATCRTGDDSLAEDHRRCIERLGAVELRLPPLRERRDDICVLAGDLIREHRQDPTVHLSADALSALRRLPWPGNLRQLETVIRSLAASWRGPITAASLPTELLVEGSRRHLTAIEELEYEAIVKALRFSKGNKVQAAKNLGLSRSTIYRKMRAYGIDDEFGLS